MSKDTETSFTGPALFIGLSLYMLATGKPAEREINPQREMKLLAAQTEQAPVDDSYTPLQMIPPLSAQPRLAMGAIVPFPTDEASLRIPSALPRARAYAVNPQLTGAGSDEFNISPTEITGPQPRRAANWLASPLSADQAPRLGRRTAMAPRRADETHPFLPKRLAQHPPMAQQPAAPSLPNAIVTGEAVHLRQQPSARSAIEAKLAEGTALKMLGTSGNWARVFAPQTQPPLTGWIYRDYIQPASQLPNSES